MARTRSARTRSMRFTLTALLVVPLVSLVVLWGFGASLTVGNALQDRTYNHLVSTGARYYDQLETQLATERLQTFIWLSTGRRSPVAPLDAARTQTDTVLAAYRANTRLTRERSSAVLVHAADALSVALARIPRIRAAADAGSLSPAAAFQDYSNLVDAEFTMFDTSSRAFGLNLNVYAQTAASVQAAGALEYLGRELTLVAGAQAAGGQMSTSDRVLFASSVASQRILIGEALSTFDPAERGPFARLYRSPLHAQLAAMENQITASAAAAPARCRSASRRSRRPRSRS